MTNVDYLIEYDKTDPISIEVYSQTLIGKTFRAATKDAGGERKGSYKNGERTASRAGTAWRGKGIYMNG